MVLTPIKHHDVTVVRVQRIPKALVDYDRAYHVAGGRYKGIVICEAVTGDVLQEAPHVLRELAVQLWDQASRVKLDKTTVVRVRYANIPFPKKTKKRNLLYSYELCK